MSRTLQVEERQAWQRLVRVLSHEINNSLAPIRSLAGSLRSALDRRLTPSETDGADLRHGLDIIGQRAEALARFMGAYARLARLPKPVLAKVAVEPWVQRVVGLVQDPRVRIGGRTRSEHRGRRRPAGSVADQPGSQRDRSDGRRPG